MRRVVPFVFLSLIVLTVGSFGVTLNGVANQVIALTSGEVTAGLGFTPGNVANPLSQFAATTSAQLRGVISDESGSGVALFAGTPVGNITGAAPTVSPTFTGTVTQPIGATPVWVKVTVSNSSTNFAVACVGPASFTAVCGAATVAKAGATTQSVALATPGASFVVDNCLIKSGTAFTGTTTLTGTVGITGTLTGCISVAYNLMAAVSTTNFGIPTVVTSAASTNGTDSIILALTSTVQNLSSISAGSVTVWLKLVLLP